MSDQYVQQAFGSGTTTATATLTGVTAGNAIVAFLFDGAGNPTTHTVNDGTAYTPGASAFDSSNFVWGGVFTLQNAGAGTHAIVGTLDSGSAAELYVFEVQAPTSGAVLDTKAATQAAPGTGANAVSSGTLTIASAATAIAMSTASNVVNAGDIPTAGTGFTSRNSGTSSVIGSWRNASGAFGSNNGGTFTALVGSDSFVTLAAAIANGAGGGGSPTITSTGSATPRKGDTFTVTGTAFGATQGTKSLKIGGVTQAIAAWSDTLITLAGVDRGTNRYGAAVNVEVWDSGSLVSNSYALTSLQPQYGWAFVDIGTPAGSGVLPASPAVASTDQAAYFTEGGLVTVGTDGVPAVTGTGYVPLSYEIWTSGSGWGSAATLVVFAQSTANTGRGTSGGTFGFTGWAWAARKRGLSLWALLRPRPMAGGADPYAPVQVWSDWVFQSTASSGAVLVAAAAGQATATAALSTGITLAAAPAGVAAATAALSTGISLQAAAAASSTATAALTTGGAAWAAAATGQATATAALSTGVVLQAAASGVSSSTAALSTGISLQAAPAASATATGALSTGIALAAAAGSASTGTAALSTGIALVAAAAGVATATAALTTTPAGLAAAASGQATATASLSTGIAMQAAASGQATATAALTTSSGAWAAAAVAQAQASAALTTAVQLQAAAGGQATATAALTTSSAAWAAAAVAQAQASAALTTAIRLQAVAAAVASATADISQAPKTGDPNYLARGSGRAWRVNAGRIWKATS